MTSYKVKSARVTDRKVGDVVTDADLAGLNVAALVEAGHIEIVTRAKAQKDNEEL
jgi:hypothetical protein